MGVDWARIERKSAYILEQVRNLGDLTRRLTKEEILHDPWVYAGVKYALHTAIEAVIELAYHVAARAFAHAPWLACATAWFTATTKSTPTACMRSSPRNWMTSRALCSR